MSEEPPAKKARKGTKSCLECRQRKVRCDWPFEGADCCQNCSARGRKCKTQEYTISNKDSQNLTSRARIAYLEGELSTVWKAVERLESFLDCTPFERDRNSPQRHVGNEAQEDSDSEESTILSNGALPTHLGYLFDDGTPDTTGSNSASLTSRTRQAQRLASLKALLPPRDDMFKITARASSWMEFNYALFPTLNVMKSGEYMMSQYDALTTNHEAGDIISVASLLLSVGMTVQHAPDHTVAPVVRSIKDGPTYVRKMSEAVERLVLADDGLAGTMEGIELSMLYLRLQISRTQLRKMWLFIRRVIALAEIISLPRASMLWRQNNLDVEIMDSVGRVVARPDTPLARKAAVWEAICAVDRIYSVLWSLPLATSNHSLPKQPIVDNNGAVRAKYFLFSLADIAGHVIDLDQFSSLGTPPIEQVDAVNAIDLELRALAASTPQSWWKTVWLEHHVDATLQFWHGYLTVRTHFQLALASHGDGRFAYNFTTCLATCQDLARRYISLRPVISPGFFANPVFDLQAFTATMFLLLTNYRAIWGSTAAQSIDVALNTDLTDGVLAAMDAAWNRSQATFARQGANAIRSLKSLFQRPHTSETDQFTLTLPLVGKVRVSRKSLAETASHAQVAKSENPEPLENIPQPDLLHGTAALPSSEMAPLNDAELADTLSFSMEHMESNPLLADEIFANEDWLTWSGWSTDT